MEATGTTIKNKKALICVTYAGGAAGFFDGLFSELEEDFDCFAPEYAGHASRLKEPLYETWNELLTDLSAQINQFIAPYDEYLLLGYSMGTAVVYELIAGKWLDNEPSHIILAAYGASDYMALSKDRYLMDDEAFADFLKTKGGFDKVDDRMLANRHFRRMFFAPIRNDYRLIHDYKRSRFIKFPMPVTVLYSVPDITEEGIHTWDQHLNEQSRYYRFEGHHFFLNDHIEEIANLIIERSALQE